MKNLLLINNIHLVFSSLIMQRGLIQTKVYYKFATLSERKYLTNLQKQQLQKNFFPSVYVIGTTCFDKCFLFDVINGRHYFFYKFIIIQSFFATTMLLYSLKKVFRKKSVFYLRYLLNNTAMLLKKVQNKASASNILLTIFLLITFILSVPHFVFLNEIY